MCACASALAALARAGAADGERCKRSGQAMGTSPSMAGGPAEAVGGAFRAVIRVI